MRSGGTPITPLPGHQQERDRGEGTRTHHPRVDTPPHPPAIPLTRFSTTEASRATQGKKKRKERKRKKKQSKEHREQKQRQLEIMGIRRQKAGIFSPCPRVDMPPDLAPRKVAVVGAARVAEAERSRGIGSWQGRRSGTDRVLRGGRGAGGPACRVRWRL